MLCTKGDFSQHKSIAHRLISSKLGMIDVIPFGSIENNYSIEWPPGYDKAMNMLGFKETHAHALQVHISDEVFISALRATPAASMSATL